MMGDLVDGLIEPEVGPPTVPEAATGVLRELSRADRAVYRAVAEFHTPVLDEPLRLVSDFANHSKPWFLTAAGLAILGGRSGRLAAVTGIAAIGITSFVVNQPMKRARRRQRPDRPGLGVPGTRWVSMPSSTSFPSGHSASAAAFATSVGHLLPATRWPLRLAAGTVAFSRVYTGVHYPGDVIIGATVGAVLGAATARIAERIADRVDRRAREHTGREAAPAPPPASPSERRPGPTRARRGSTGSS